MQYHFDMPNFSEDKCPLLLFARLNIEAVAVLLEGQGVIAQVGFKARVSWSLSHCAPAEKGPESQINALDHILQDLRMHLGQIRAHLFACWQFCALVGVADRCS